MKKSKLVLTSFLCSLGVFGYVMLVSGIINNAENWFGTANNFWGPVIFLLVFVFSALITGLLVLGYPIWLYFEQKKKEAVWALAYNAGWLFVILISAGIILKVNYHLLMLGK